MIRVMVASLWFEICLIFLFAFSLLVRFLNVGNKRPDGIRSGGVRIVFAIFKSESCIALLRAVKNARTEDKFESAMTTRFV